MKCAECGREIVENQKFCKYCGAPVKQIHVSTENIGQTMRCRGCGAVLKPGTAFCTQCGVPVSSIVNVPVTKENVKTKGSIAWKIIIAVITVIALSLVVFIGYYFADQYGIFERDREEKMETDSEDTESKKPVNEETKTTESILDEEIELEESPVAEGVDVEDMVLRIRDKYDKIVNGISSNSYDVIMIDEGAMAYSEQDQIKAIVVKKDYGGSDYARYFYYDGGKLFFAFYESTDSHRLYFDGDQLLRWRYCSDAANTSNALNYDLENTSEYYRWENDVLVESEKLLDAWEDVLASGTGIQEYILVGSDARYISKSELKEFTAEQCRLARNEIYARHGRMFDDEYLQEYFNSKEWYAPSIASGDFEESLLNSYEIANRDLIVEYEKECGYR